MVRPLLLLACALGLGALLGETSGAAAAVPLLLIAALLLAAAPVVSPRSAWAALGAAAVAVGAAAWEIERLEHERSPLRLRVVAEGGASEPWRLEGIALTDARDLGERWLLVLRVERVFVSGREELLPGQVRVEIGGGAARPEVIEGDRVSLWASLRLPRGFDNPGSQDATADARRRGIHAFGYCKSARLVQRTGRGALGPVRGATAHARAWGLRTLTALVPAGPEQALVRAMVLGDRAALDPEAAEAFRIAGTYHVLALSGAQVALVAGLVMVLLRRTCPSPLASAAIAALVLSLYALLVGSEVPVVRAAVMASVLAFGRAVDLDADPANLLGLAGGLLLVGRPSSIGDVAFQLSFGATLGILLLAPPLMRCLPRLPLRIDLALVASLAAQAALAPLLALHFHRLAPAALLLNLVAVPLSAATLVCGAAVLAAAPIWLALARLLGQIAWGAAHALLLSGEVVRWLPVLDMRTGDVALWALAPYVAGLWLWARGRQPLPSLGLLGIGTLGLVLGRGSVAPDGRLHLTALDVGQGDGLVVRSPRGRLLAVDAGGSLSRRFDVGEAVVAPYLWGIGARRLDRVLVTHAHPDHAGGVPFLLRTFEPVEAWEGLAPRRDPGYQELDRSLKAARVARRSVAHGVRELWDGVEIEVLGPQPGRRPPWKTRNDDSVVLLLRFGARSFLLAGDIEAPAEAVLPLGPVDVVKVPHHGSRSSSSERFVRATAPRIAIVSAGGRFGHPHAEVLERYRQLGALVLRTDRDGAVDVSTDGTTLWTRTYAEGRWRPVPERPRSWATTASTPATPGSP